MKQMNEAVPEEDFDRMQRGLPPIKKPAEARTDPEPPVVKDRVDLKNLNIEDVVAVVSCARRSVRNSQAILFMGYDIALQMKKGTVSGWMPEADFLNFKRMIGTRINTSAIEM